MAAIFQGQLRSFEIKFADKVPLTSSNIPNKFCWNNQHAVGEKHKNAISGPKNGRHFKRSRSFEVRFVDKVPFTPTNVLGTGMLLVEFSDTSLNVGHLDLLFQVTRVALFH